MQTNSSELMDQVLGSGFPEPESLIHLFVGGSQLHGAKVAETDDLDIYGVFVEQPEVALGLDPTEHFVWSTAGNERRNGPEDVDVTLYSVRKWARMAANGNPTALHFLFAQNALSNEAWTRVTAQKEVFLAKSAAARFIGFAENQFKRIGGELGRGKKGKRPDLEGQFGYDVKAAMHALRLLLECIELMKRGKLTFPRPERQFLVDVRSGKWSFDAFERKWFEILEDTQLAVDQSPLPDEVDRAAISGLLADVYRLHWDRRAL